VCVHDAVVIMFSRQLELMQQHSDYYNFPPNFPPKLSTVRFVGFCVVLNHVDCIFPALAVAFRCESFFTNSPDNETSESF